jgi:hypothetical protein
MNMHDKPVYELSLADYQANPVWTWVDDDENLVTPVQLTNDWRQEHDAVFVLSSFLLGDGTSASGMVAVRAKDLSVYFISIFSADGRFVGLPLQQELESLVSRESFASELGKTVAEVFPIKFQTTVPIFLLLKSRLQRRYGRTDLSEDRSPQQAHRPTAPRWQTVYRAVGKPPARRYTALRGKSTRERGGAYGTPDRF